MNGGTIDAASLDPRHFQATHSVAEPLGVVASSVRRTRLFHRPFIELRGTRREDSIAIACESCWRAELGGKSKRANASYDHRVFRPNVAATFKFDITCRSLTVGPANVYGPGLRRIRKLLGPTGPRYRSRKGLYKCVARADHCGLSYSVLGTVFSCLSRACFLTCSSTRRISFSGK